jgi:predicted aconitase
VELEKPLRETFQFGALGKVIGEKIGNKIPLIVGQDKASIEELKSLSASIATYGGTAMFHMDGITPSKTKKPKEKIVVSMAEIEAATKALTTEEPADFVSIGCPHASIKEIEKIARLLKGKKVKKEVWITTARPTKRISDMMGYTKTIEETGVKFAADTCCVVAPIKGRFKVITTDSAKGCFYAASKNKSKVKLKSVEDCIKEATE